MWQLQRACWDMVATYRSINRSRCKKCCQWDFKYRRHPKTRKLQYKSNGLYNYWMHPGSNGNFLMLKRCFFFSFASCLKKTSCFSTGTLLRWFGLSVDAIFGGLVSFQGSLKTMFTQKLQYVQISGTYGKQYNWRTNAFLQQTIQICPNPHSYNRFDELKPCGFIYLFYFTAYAACRRASICSYFTPVPWDMGAMFMVSAI